MEGAQELVGTRIRGRGHTWDPGPPQERQRIAMSTDTRVIVGVDGSHHSLTVLHRAVEEARERDALLVPVTAWMASDEGGLRPLSELAHSARQRLDTIFELAFGGYPQGVRIHPVVQCAEPGRALVALADRPDDLLVVGSGRHGRVQHVVHGPVARHCWTHATCEVVLVPRSELPDPAGSVRASSQLTESLGVAVHCHAGARNED